MKKGVTTVSDRRCHRASVQRINVWPGGTVSATKRSRFRRAAQLYQQQEEPSCFAQTCVRTARTSWRRI